MPKVSVIIPTYNSAQFIERTIKSVQHQIYTDWELLIVDDKSLDTTRELVRGFAKADSRIRFVELEKNSGGPAHPKNVGVELAKGDYIAFLDHDDEWFPEKLGRQVFLFESSKYEKLGVVACYTYIVDSQKGETLSRYDAFHRGSVIQKLTQNNFLFTSSCIMVKRVVFERAGMFDVSFKTADDWDMWLRVAEEGYAFDCTPNYLVNYFLHGGNASHVNTKHDRTDEFLQIFNKHKESFSRYNHFGTGYAYFKEGRFFLSQKYFMRAIFFDRLSMKEFLKACVYVILLPFPKMAVVAQNIWRLRRK